MLSNAYFLAKFRFDTAENEPAKNLQNFRKMHFRKMHFRKMHFRKMHFQKMHKCTDRAGSPPLRSAGSPGYDVRSRGVPGRVALAGAGLRVRTPEPVLRPVVDLLK